MSPFTSHPSPLSVSQFPVIAQFWLAMQKDNRHSDGWQLMGRLRDIRNVSIITGGTFRILHVYLFKIFSIIGKSYLSISNRSWKFPLSPDLNHCSLSLIIDLCFSDNCLKSDQYQESGHWGASEALLSASQSVVCDLRERVCPSVPRRPNNNYPSKEKHSPSGLLIPLQSLITPDPLSQRQEASYPPCPAGAISHLRKLHIVNISGHVIYSEPHSVFLVPTIALYNNLSVASVAGHEQTGDIGGKRDFLVVFAKTISKQTFRLLLLQINSSYEYWV